MRPGRVLPQDGLEMRVRRRVGPGMLDEIAFTDHSAAPYEATLSIEVDGDFADVAEIDDIRQQHGTVTRGLGRGRAGPRARVPGRA